MELTRKQFEVLEVLATRCSTLTQREVADLTSHSLGTVNRILKELAEKKLVLDGLITPAGLTALEPYKIKRAIFIAAGFGTRLVPITFNTPKPLVRVHGVYTIIHRSIPKDDLKWCLVNSFNTDTLDYVRSACLGNAC